MVSSNPSADQHVLFQGNYSDPHLDVQRHMWAEKKKEERHLEHTSTMPISSSNSAQAKARC
jgi:hypothetical protein